MRNQLVGRVLEIRVAPVVQARRLTQLSSGSHLPHFVIDLELAL